MKMQVQEWGSSLAMRIPKSVAADVDVRERSELDLAVVDGELIASPTRPRRMSLGPLLSRVTRTNLHGEAETGTPVGREVL